MYYSVVQVNGPIILLEDPSGDLQTFTSDFFEYDVKENDLVYLQNGKFYFAQEETERVKKQNFDRLNRLISNKD